MLVIDFPDVDRNAFQAIVDYMYSDFDESAITIPESSLLNTLYAGTLFHFPAIK